MQHGAFLSTVELDGWKTFAPKAGYIKWENEQPDPGRNPFQTGLVDGGCWMAGVGADGHYGWQEVEPYDRMLA